MLRRPICGCSLGQRNAQNAALVTSPLVPAPYSRSHRVIDFIPSRLCHPTFSRPISHPSCTSSSDGFDPAAASEPRVPKPGGIYNNEISASLSSVKVEPSTSTPGSPSSSGDGYQSSRAVQHLLSNSPRISHAATQTPSIEASRDLEQQPQQQQQQQHAPNASSSAPSTASTSVNSYSAYYRQQQQADATPDADMQASSNPSSQKPSIPERSSSPASASTPNSASANAPASSVAEALSRAQQALDKVESSLESIDQLPSARPASESRFTTALSTARTVAAVGVFTAALLTSHAFGLIVQWISAVLCGAGIAVWGYRKGSLSQSGAVAAAAVGLSTLGCSLRLGLTLLAFFFSSSKLTQYKEEMKSGLDDQAKKGGQRDWIQVLCNALVPTALAITYGVLAGCVDVPLGPLPSLEAWRAKAVTALMGGFLGYYACCCGDTWASELGPLSADTPCLITTMRPVRKGTNGGVTLLGLSASILGGAFIGATFYTAAVVSPTLFIFEQQHMIAIEQWKLIPLGLMAGLLGSVLDSVLGATVQYSGYNSSTDRVTSKPGPNVQHISGLPLLSNNAVNAVSASVTAVVTALAALKAFGF